MHSYCCLSGLAQFVCVYVCNSSLYVYRPYLGYNIVHISLSTKTSPLLPSMQHSQPVDSATPLDQERPVSITNAVQFRNAIVNGDENTQTQMLKLLKGIFNPQMQMAIWSSGDSFTQMQKITAIKQMKPLSDATGAIHDRAFIIHTYNPSRPVLVLYDVRESFTFQLNIGPSAAQPVVTFTKKTWIHEANQPLQPSPQPASIASRARINSLRLLVAAAGNTVSGLVTNGAINATSVSDFRGNEELDPSKMASTANIDKNVVSNEGLQTGVVAIQGPYIGDMTIANPLFEGGLGEAGEAANILASPVEFNYPGNLVSTGQDAQSFWVSGTVPAAGAAILPTFGPNAPLMNEVVWISSKTTLSAGTARIRNVTLQNIGFENYPEFTFTCNVPANMTMKTYNPEVAVVATVPLTAVAASPQTIHVMHWYANATVNGTLSAVVFESRSETIVVPVPVFNPNEPVIYFGSASPGTATAPPGAPVYSDNWIGQRRPVQVHCRAPPVDNYTWIGTMVQCVDATQFPTGFLGSAGNTGPGTWNSATFANCAQLGNQQFNLTDYLGAPWWSIQNTELLPLIKPQLAAIDVKIPRLYDANNLSGTMLTVSNVTAGQTYNVELHAQLELTATGDVSTFQKAGADVTITDTSAVQLLEMAFNTPGNELRVNFPLPLYKEIEKQVADAATFGDLMKIEAFRSPKFMQAAKSAGLFGSLGSALGGIFGQQGAAIGGMLGGVGDQAMALAPMLAAGRYGEVAKQGRYPLAPMGEGRNVASGMFGAAGAYPMLGASGMFGEEDATGMFGADDDQADADTPSARAAFGLKLRNGQRVGPPRTLPGPNPGLPNGILVSHTTLKRMVDTLQPIMVGAGSGFPGWAGGLMDVQPPAEASNRNTGYSWAEVFYDPVDIIRWFREVENNLIIMLQTASQGSLPAQAAAQDVQLASGMVDRTPLTGLGVNDPAFPILPQNAACALIQSPGDMASWLNRMTASGYAIPNRAMNKILSGFSAGAAGGAPVNPASPLSLEFQQWYPNGTFSQAQANRYTYYGFIGMRLSWVGIGLPADLFDGSGLDPYAAISQLPLPAGIPAWAKYASRAGDPSSGKRGPPTWIPEPFTPNEYNQWRAANAMPAGVFGAGRARAFGGGYGATGVFGESDRTMQRRTETAPVRRITDR